MGAENLCFACRTSGSGMCLLEGKTIDRLLFEKTYATQGNVCPRVEDLIDTAQPLRETVNRFLYTQDITPSLVEPFKRLITIRLGLPYTPARRQISTWTEYVQETQTEYKLSEEKTRTILTAINIFIEEHKEKLPIIYGHTHYDPIDYEDIPKPPDTKNVTIDVLDLNRVAGFLPINIHPDIALPVIALVRELRSHPEYLNGSEEWQKVKEGIISNYKKPGFDACLVEKKLGEILNPNLSPSDVHTSFL